MNSNAPRVLLASASPRRRALLSAAGFDVTVRAADVNEDQRAGENAVDYAARVALDKAKVGLAARGPEEPAWALGSDTVVALAGEVLGKPSTPAEAVDTLDRLSGQTHAVHTAIALCGPRGEMHVEVHTARVRFRPLEPDEVRAYVATGDAFDKAGAYGIQGGAGAFVEAVDGPYDGVVGLPVAQVFALGARAGAWATEPEMVTRLRALRGRVAAACQAVQREPASVTLVGVSKRHPPERLREALALGVTDLGENYVQEWRDKATVLAEDDVRWHFVGRLQSNKAKVVAGQVALVHAVDSLSTAQAWGRAVERSPGAAPQQVLVQVSLAGEAQKGGVTADALPDLLDTLDTLGSLRVEGLMTMPPEGTLCGARAVFQRLRTIRDHLARPERPLTMLSMGMSDDFDQAIAEGATHIRVGTALFGSRPG
jgi:MAF protein